MKSSVSFLIFSLLVFGSTSSLAQMGLEGFASGRYEVRKSPDKRKPASTESETASASSEKEKPQAVSVKVEAAKAVAPAAAIVATEKLETSSPALPSVVEEPSITEQAESLFSNKAEKIYEFYRTTVHPDDVRNNRVELEVSPVMMYQDSKSDFVYRNYQSFFNALKVKTNVWLTPRLGVTGQFMFSLAADMDGVNNSARVPTKYESMDLGVNFRKFFGASRLSNSVEFSLLYSDDKVNTESENTSRARLRTNGLGVGLKTRIPMSESYAWTLGGSFFPRLQHTEVETGAVISSGSTVENTRFGLDLGGEFKFDRESQVIWNLGVSAERNVFDGAASLPDPGSGATASNVSVTKSVFMFSLGYRWGH